MKPKPPETGESPRHLKPDWPWLLAMAGVLATRIWMVVGYPQAQLDADIRTAKDRISQQAKDNTREALFKEVDACGETISETTLKCLRAIQRSDPSASPKNPSDSSPSRKSF